MTPPRLPTVDGRERRSATLSDVTVTTRAKAGGDGIEFVGYASVFGVTTAIGDPKVGGFTEEVERGAFMRAIHKGRDDVRFLVNHDPNQILARSSSGTLRLSEDYRGLKVVADLAPTTLGKDVAILLERGDLSEMSFAFRVEPGGEEWTRDSKGHQHRVLRDLSLYDVSVVAFPAYPQTAAAIAKGKAPRSSNPALLRRWMELQEKTATQAALARRLGDRNRR